MCLVLVWWYLGTWVLDKGTWVLDRLITYSSGFLTLWALVHILHLHGPPYSRYNGGVLSDTPVNHYQDTLNISIQDIRKDLIMKKKEMLTLAQELTDFFYEHDYYNCLENFSDYEDCLEYTLEELHEDPIYVHLYVRDIFDEGFLDIEECSKALYFMNKIEELEA